MLFGYLILGFIARIVMGFDDALTHIPLLSSLARTKKGRLSFSAGILLSIIIAIALAWIFSNTLKTLPYFKEILAIILFILAFAIAFDIGIFAPRKKVEEKMVKAKKISLERMASLFGIGFSAGLATVLDDLVVYTALFTAGFAANIFSSVGILVASVLELYLVLHSARFIAKLKHKDQISAAGLFLVGILLLSGVL